MNLALSQFLSSPSDFYGLSNEIYTKSHNLNYKCLIYISSVHGVQLEHAIVQVSKSKVPTNFKSLVIKACFIF